MNKKLYIQPALNVFNVEKPEMICSSPDISDYDGPLGAPMRQEESSGGNEMFKYDWNTSGN